MTYNKYMKLPYHKAMAYLKSLPSSDRNDFQKQRYQELCAEEIAAIPENIKEHCVICGKGLKMTHKRYEKYGNYCRECDLKITIQMSIEMGLFKSHGNL